MINTMPDNYVHCYQELQDLLMEGYCNSYLLKAIGQLSISDMPNDSTFVLSHFIELSKRDLCLVIWKLLLDENKNANSISKLNRMLNNSLVHMPIFQRPDLGDLALRIRAFRDQSIAHTDRKRRLETIPIADLEKALDIAKDMLNQCCFSDVEPSIVKITDSHLMGMKIKTQLGIGKLICGTTRC